MKSIAMMNSVLPSVQKKYSLEASSPVIDNAPQTKSSVTASDKQLQPDQVEISDASRQKLSASEEKEKEQQSDFFENVETEEKLGATSEVEESDLDEKIRELSLEILELTLKIEMLKSKEDMESMQEAQELEVELAVKKGTLDAMVTQKLEMASRGL